MDRIIIIGTSRGGGGIPFGGPDAMRSLIRFDISGLTSPAESAILELTVHSFDNGSSSSVYTVDVHNIVDSTLTPWIEGNGATATYPYAPPGASGTDPAFGVAWAGAGDNPDPAAANNQTQPPFDPLVIASATIDQGVDEREDVIQWDITSLVNSWISGGSNNGIMLTDTTANGLFRGVNFGAREGNIYSLSDAVDGPRLLYEPAVVEVYIDIKPGSDPNCFNINGHGVIPVAILGSELFDVNEINVDTLFFGGLQVRVRGNKGPLCSYELVNDDFFLDLVCHFEDNADNWKPGNGVADITGELQCGTLFMGTDSICIVP
jgi:hypothetical protein